jgi:hypothetical protein
VPCAWRAPGTALGVLLRDARRAGRWHAEATELLYECMIDMIAAASRHGAGCVKSGKGRASRVGAGTAGRGARSAAVLAARLAFCDMARAPLFAWRLFEAL